MPFPRLRNLVANVRSAFTSDGIVPTTTTTGVAYQGWGRPTASGIPINDQSSLTIPSVQRAIRLYCDTISAMDLYPAERPERAGAIPVPATRHWSYDLVRRRPNDRMTSMGLRSSLILHALCRGNGYAEIEWADHGRSAVALHLMNPATTVPKIVDGALVYDIGSGKRPLPASDVIHLAGFGWDGIAGYSPVALFAESLGVARAQTVYEGSLYGNGGMASGILQFPGRMDEAQQAQHRKGWQDTYGGTGNAGKVGILADGAKWVQTSFSPADAELILSRNYTVQDVARMWSLPLHWLSPDAPQPKSEEEAWNTLFKGSLLPVITRLEQELEIKLLSKPERARYSFHHDYRTLLRADVRTQMERNSALFKMGAVTPNEVRDDQGLPRLDSPEADKPFMEMNNFASYTDPKADPAPQQVVPPVADPDPTPPTKVSEPTTKPIDEAKARRAMRALLADPIDRLLKVERKAIEAKASRDDFAQWAEDNAPKNAARMADALAPSVDAINAALGTALDARSIARAIADENLATLRSEWTAFTPAELPARLGPILAAWDGRADALAGQFLKQGV